MKYLVNECRIQGDIPSATQSGENIKTNLCSKAKRNVLKPLSQN